MRAENDPKAMRLRATHALLDDYEGLVRKLSVARRDPIQALLDDGWSQTDIAEMLGITRSRISQLVRQDDPN